ncbi:MAG TPA: HAD family hydrolase [Bryobacteraceae bacterium]|nr:HAD family hydrolase [Bryobacteraceae bacterium]
MRDLSPRPRAILFDLDGTLFNREATVRELVRDQHRRFGSELAHVPAETYVQRVLELDAHGYVDKDLVYGEAAQEFGFSGALANRLIDDFQENFYGLGRCFPEVLCALGNLRALGIRLGIITNGRVSIQERKIRQLGLMELFDEVLISEREGVRKPDARIFARALDRLGVRADRAWYVGDHPDTDIRGAFDAGLTPVWRYTTYWPRPGVPAREIRGIDELLV